MNARERYLAVYNDSERKKLDRVPIFVQYIKEEFISENRDAILNSNNPGRFNNLYFDIPYALGFESIFASFADSFKSRSIKVTNDIGQSVRIGTDGQAKRSSTFYEGGCINSLDILEELWTTVKKVDVSTSTQKLMRLYDSYAPYIFPVLQLGGIFDRTWQAMGFTNFSKHFHKKTKLYQELIKFYAELTTIQIEGLIEATGNQGKVVNILDDAAYKGRSIIAPERWEQDFMPHYKEINSMISDAGLIPQVHTDGDVTDLIPSLQKAGFKGLQGWEGGCDPYFINDNYPDFVVVGFGDVSDILPHGTPEQIDAHVKDLMNALKENRHFIIGPSTVIFKEISLRNVQTFIKAIRKYGTY